MPGERAVGVALDSKEVRGPSPSQTLLVGVECLPTHLGLGNSRAPEPNYQRLRRHWLPGPALLDANQPLTYRGMESTGW